MHRNTRDSSLALIDVYAHQMRTALTPSEQALWQRIRRGQLGVWFRRQTRIGRFVVDFVAPAARLVIEVDGGYHGRRRSADARRDRKLGRLGYRVLRLEATLVENEVDAAVARVRDALAGAR